MVLDAMFDALLRITENPAIAFILMGYFAGVATKNGLTVAQRIINRMFGIVPTDRFTGGGNGDSSNNNSAAKK